MEDKKMLDLTTVLGSLMTSIVGARKIADEQSAILAEYYKENPLLEGLSVPRIRIPELIIDMPLMIEKHSNMRAGKMSDIRVILEEANNALKETLTKNKIDVGSDFIKTFSDEIEIKLKSLESTSDIVLKESILRNIQEGFFSTMSKTKNKIEDEYKDMIIDNIKNKVSKKCFIKDPKAPNIIVNVLTSHVKDKCSHDNCVRLKVTLQEEGLEWTTHKSDTGTVSKLQPE
jgi:hypothetical protein